MNNTKEILLENFIIYGGIIYCSLIRKLEGVQDFETCKIVKEVIEAKNIEYKSYGIRSNEPTQESQKESEERTRKNFAGTCVNGEVAVQQIKHFVNELHQLIK